MPTIISFILITLALAVALLIILKKFPALAILDVNKVPGEKEAKFKEQIIKQRVERDLAQVSGFFGRIWLSWQKRWLAFLQSRQARLQKIKKSYKIGLKLPWSEKQKKIRELSLAAEEDLKKEEYGDAEAQLVEIITLDQKNLDAFFRLGNLYYDQKKWPEARQTYEHALKLINSSHTVQTAAETINDLTPQEIYFCLASVAKEAGDWDQALDNIRSALDLEPNSPRYLDLILDLSIIKKDRELAAEFWEKMAAVNPENNKLAEWKEKIANLDNVKTE